MPIDYEKVNNVLELFDSQVHKFENKPYLWQKINNKYESHSWREIFNKVCKIALSLKSLGVLEGDRVLLVSENRPEWLISDLAIMAVGAITVPAYITSTSSDYDYIISHSQVRAAIISNDSLTQKVLPAIEKAPKCKALIKINEDNIKYDNPVGIFSWNKLLDENNEKDFNFLESIKTIQRNDVACIIYTSGTGGNPKGVMLSHRALLTNCKGADILLKEITSNLNEIRFLSWLPLSHSYEHTLQFFIIGLGAQIYYAEGIDKLVVNMSESKPHLMTAVPRFYDSLHTRISQGLKKQGKLSQILFAETLKLGKKVYFNQKLSFFEKFINSLLDKVVRKKVKKRFGGNLEALISGGSALNFEVGLYLTSLGLPLLQGYGQTETGPVVSANPPSKIKLDTVGTMFDGVTVKIAEDGEILVHGNNVMNGYWNDPDSTAATIKNGWVHTGDIGEIDNEGYLKITDRKKDIIVNAGGDNISPSRIEEKIDINPEINQSMVYGDFKNYLVSIIVPDRDIAIQWAKENNKDSSLPEIINDKDFNSLIKKIIDNVNKELSTAEQVRKFILINEEFTIDNKMMTPTMKLRRFKIKEKYGDKLESLY